MLRGAVGLSRSDKSVSAILPPEQHWTEYFDSDITRNSTGSLSLMARGEM